MRYSRVITSRVPAGLFNESEDLETAVRRELYEETGLALTKVRYLSPPVASSAGLTDESAVMAFVDCEGIPHTRNVEESEDIELVILDFAQMCAIRRSQERFSSRAWLTLLMFEAHGRLDWPPALLDNP
jgi:ADP-ribose pyrophosphatase